jgi:UDP-N-acetylglucosamine 2-epimerase (non-hydrolysing)
MACAVNVACVVGTRPEAVKMAPVVIRLRRTGSGFAPRIIATGQHREMVTQALAHFGLQPDIDLATLRPGQSLAELSARLLVGLDEVLVRERPDLVLAQGDTTSVLCAGLAAHYRQVPFGHVEAGLRTGRADAPFPEETNRVLASHLAALHFAPTEMARTNLVREGISADVIHLTGNTVIDALLLTLERRPPLPIKPPTERFVLVTAHRRENWPDMDEIAKALRDLVARNADLGVVFPVHPNPALRDVISDRLGGLGRVRLLEPVGYPEFVALMQASYLVLTDSGGVQEEAPALGKPVLVMRDTTERPEAVEAGTAQLVGPRHDAIVSAVENLWHCREAYERQARVANPYGDGRAASRIHRAIAEWFGVASRGSRPSPFREMRCVGALPEGSPG